MLKVDAISSSYATASVLESVSLDVAEGEVVVILGRNGMGKTTLVRTICGISPPALTSGRIMMDGKEITGLASHAVARRGIGLVPQGRRVFGSLTVEENLDVVPQNGGVWSTESVYELFPRLYERRNQWSRTLSGGEQQMLSIGRALKTSPKLLIMDEPSEGLAPTVLDVIRERLRQLRDTGQSVLVAEQNVDLALELADSITILGEGGQMVWAGSVESLQDDPTPIHTHLGI